MVITCPSGQILFNPQIQIMKFVRGTGSAVQLVDSDTLAKFDTPTRRIYRRGD